MEINSHDYNNVKVMELLQTLPPFKWGKPAKDSVKRCMRPLMMLENGAKYEGEW